MALHFAHQPIILILTQLALPLGPAIDNRPRWPRRVIQQRLRPTARGVMHIHRHRRRLQGAKAVVIVLGVKIADMTNRRHRPAGVKAMLAPAHRIFVSHRPTIRPRHHAHPVRPQHMQLDRQTTLAADRLDIAIAAQQHLTIQRLKQLCPALPRIRAAHQFHQRMFIIAPRRVLHDQRQGRRRLGNQLDRPKPHWIAAKARSRQAHTVPRAPGNATRGLIGHDRRGRRSLLLNRLSRAAP